MKKPFTFTIAATALTSAPAFAHAGDHQGMALHSVIEHVLTHPFHVGLAFGLIGAAYGGYRLMRHKSQEKQ